MNELDTSLLLLINGWHNDFFDHVMYAYSGKLVWIPLYVSLAFVVVRNLMPRRQADAMRLRHASYSGSWTVVAACLLGVALTILLADQVSSSLIRPAVARLRPSNPDNPISELVHIVNGRRGGRYGFPSCHAANTFGLAVYFFLLFRQRALTWLLVGWALVTCYSRAYLGVHYPGDLLVGALIGTTSAVLMYGLVVRATGYHRPPRVEYQWLPPLAFALTLGAILIYAAVKVAS